MIRRWRTKRVLKWSGTTLCLLLLIIAGVTVRWRPAWGVEALNCAVALERGGVLFFRADAQFDFPGAAVAGVSGVEWFLRSGNPGAMSVVRGSFSGISRKRPAGARWQWRPWASRGKPFSIAFLPYWIPFLLPAVPTGLLWWYDRRVPRGHCPRCGYNLTGNASGRCPECGTPLSAAKR